MLTVLFSMLPFGFAEQVHYSVVIGASGAIYGLLLAFALYFPDQPIYMYFVFPIPARIFVLIIGGIELLSSLSGGGDIANATHLGGILVGFLGLKSGRMHPLAELRVPLPQMEDQPGPAQVRRLLGRPRRRLGSPRSLILAS